jgi:hypothetical protein
MRALALVALLAPMAAGQLRLALIPAPGQELPVTGAHDMGSVAVGDTLEARFRIRNLGAANVTLTRLTVAGQGFSLAGDPTPPFLMTPGTNVDFFVRLRPTGPGGYSASLQFNEQSVMLYAQATPSVEVLAESGGAMAPLGSLLDFGLVERGSTAARALRLANPNNAPIQVGTLAADAPFEVRGIAAPLSVAPGESASFEIVYTARRAGPERGLLRIDGRTFALAGFGIEPPMPEPEIVFSTENAASAQQIRVSVRLAAASRTSGTGKLSVALLPLAAGAIADAGIQFLATGTTEIDFAVAEGAAAAAIDGRAEATFQTGTTAGTLVFTARLGEHTRQALLRIPAIAASIDAAHAIRASNALDVQIAGFDNTRTLSRLRFQFFDRGGAALGSAIDAEVAPEFRRFFESSTAGGVFGLRAVFPVAGDASLVAGVEVELTNGAGVTRTTRIAF